MNYHNKSLQLKEFFIDSGTILIAPVIEDGKITDPGTIIGPLEGTQSFTVERTFREIEVARKFTKTKGLTILESETASITCTVKGIDAEAIKLAIQGKSEENTSGDMVIIESTGKIALDDYISLVALVGEIYNAETQESADGFIVIENGLNTNGLTFEMADNAEAGIELIFEAHAEVEEAGVPKAPYKIYLPKKTI